MTLPDYNSLFRRYAAVYERSLRDTVEVDAIRSFFAEAFVSAGLDGRVNAGHNDERFAATLSQAYDFYKAIGTRAMRVERVEATPLCEGHDRVRVFYIAEYEKAGGQRLRIPFDVVYLLQQRADGPKVFAFIAGDEMALYKQHGLVDADGKPAASAAR